MSEHSDSVAQDPQSIADFPFATFEANTFAVVMSPIEELIGNPTGTFDSNNVEPESEPVAASEPAVRELSDDQPSEVEPIAEAPITDEPAIETEQKETEELAIEQPEESVAVEAESSTSCIAEQRDVIEQPVMEQPTEQPTLVESEEPAVAETDTEPTADVIDAPAVETPRVDESPVKPIDADILPGVTRFYGNVQVSGPSPKPSAPPAREPESIVHQPTKPVVTESVEEVVEAQATAKPTTAIVDEVEPAARAVESNDVPETVKQVPAVETIDVPVVETQTETHVKETQAEAPPEPNAKVEKVEEPATGFRSLALIEDVQVAVEFAGYETPTPIQAQIIPHMLEGRDVLAQSQTGSGKTAAFALPILSTINIRERSPQVLVLVPTRELAMQVAASFSKYSREMRGFEVAPIYGGADYGAQFRQLKRGLHVVVGTPGRVIDHIKRGSLNIGEINCLVLDEADEMLNMGFLDDVKFVLERAPAQRQIALFSATLPAPIRDISKRYLTNPARVTIQQQSMTADSIRQRALMVTPHDKIEVLARIVEAEETDGVIVFTKTKDATVTVAEKLNRAGLSAIALNGDMPQRTRERAIEQLKAGHLNILVATDVAARGLDVSRVSHVINYDMPNDGESYTHRIGRTGRAGRTGEAIIFVTGTQRGKLRLIERVTKQPIQVVDPPSAEEINAKRAKRFQDRITQAIEAQDLSMFEEMITKFSEETDTPMVKIAAALADISQNGRPFLMKELRKPKAFEGKPPRRDRSERGDRDDSRGRGDGKGYGQRVGHQRSSGGGRSGDTEEGMDRYRIEVGKRDGVKPGNIVGAIANEGGIDGAYIGAIQIHDSHTTIDLPEGMPRAVFETLQEVRVAGKQIRLKLAGEEQHQSRYGSRSSRPSGPRPGNGGPRGGAGKKFSQNKSFHGGKRKKRRSHDG